MCRPALIILPEALLIIKYFALYGYFYEKIDEIWVLPIRIQ